MNKSSFYLVTLMLTALTVTVNAGTSLNIKKNPLYTEGRITMQFMTGALFSDSGIGPDIDEFNHQQNNFRVGWIVNSPEDFTDEDHPLRGCFELLGELSFSGVMSTYGSVLIGPTVLVRYNFVQPDWFVVPYLQVGGGIVYNDAHETETQRAIGQAIEFTPQASAGARWLIEDEWTFDTEFMYHHISNAGMNDRNLGVNSFGGFVGFTHFFDKLWD